MKFFGTLGFTDRAFVSINWILYQGKNYNYILLFVLMISIVLYIYIIYIISTIPRSTHSSFQYIRHEVTGKCAETMDKKNLWFWKSHIISKTRRSRFVFDWRKVSIYFCLYLWYKLYKYIYIYEYNPTKYSQLLSVLYIIASEESFLLSHMATQKNAIKPLILVLEQFCIEHFLILFQF